jgi:uncharacterized protein HemX
MGGGALDVANAGILVLIFITTVFILRWGIMYAFWWWQAQIDKKVQEQSMMQKEDNEAEEDEEERPKRRTDRTISRRKY